MVRRSTPVATTSDDPTVRNVERDAGGPLPSAAELERIERLCTGATDRILGLVERQQAHRTDWENKSREAYAQERRRAQFCAFAFALSGLAAALVLGVLGQQTAATVIGSTTIGGVVASFILGTRSGGAAGGSDHPSRHN